MKTLWLPAIYLASYLVLYFVDSKFNFMTRFFSERKKLMILMDISMYIIIFASLYLVQVSIISLITYLYILTFSYIIIGLPLMIVRARVKKNKYV